MATVQGLRRVSRRNIARNTGETNEDDILRAESDLQLALEKIPGIKTHTYESDIFNYKITYKEDLEIARRLLESRC